MVLITGFAIMQPDVGMLIIIISASFLLFFSSSLDLKTKIYSPLIFLVVSVLGITALYFASPNNYVIKRIETSYLINFGEITHDLRYGDAFHQIKNIESVRKGGLTGQGLLNVSQNTRSIPPEISTDSIFAYIAASTGFVGSVVIILFYSYLIYLLFSVCRYVEEERSRLLVVGLTSLIAIQFLLNIYVIIGFPITGIPLVFFSVGGTAIIVTLAIIGMILGILKENTRQLS